MAKAAHFQATFSTFFPKVISFWRSSIAPSRRKFVAGCIAKKIIAETLIVPRVSG